MHGVCTLHSDNFSDVEIEAERQVEKAARARNLETEINAVVDDTAQDFGVGPSHGGGGSIYAFGSSVEYPPITQS